MIDAEGLIITPGLIDLHCHVAKDIVRLSVDPDTAGLAKGCTTLVDAGSIGELLFAPFRKCVMDRARARILAFLNIESLGMIEFQVSDPPYEEQQWAKLLMKDNESMASMFVNLANTSEVIEKNRDVIIGIKWAHHGLEILRLARKAADNSNVLLMAENHYEPEVLKYLNKGDIITHIFHYDYNTTLGRYDGISEDLIGIIPEIYEASRRGVIIDVGHGRGSFSWKLAERALERGLKPDVISTDLWAGNLNGPVYDLPTTLSKFLHLGMSLEEVIAATTKRPAEAIGRLGKIGTLKEDAIADVSLFRVKEGKHSLTDCYGETRTADRLIVCTNVIRSGQVIEIPGFPM